MNRDTKDAIDAAKFGAFLLTLSAIILITAMHSI